MGNICLLSEAPRLVWGPSSHTTSILCSVRYWLVLYFHSSRTC